MSKKKRERMKAKQRRHAASRPPTQPTDTEAATASPKKTTQRPTRKARKRQPKRWLGLTSRQWLWIGVAAAVVVVAAFLIWWWLIRQPAAATPIPTEVTEPVPTVIPATPTPAAAMERPLAAMSPADRVGYYDAPPEMQIDPAKQYVATIHTERGNIVVELYGDKAPKTVNNFVFLANQGYYDGITFHRVIPGFMAQAGDPSATGSGGPGYTFEDEFHPDLRHDGPGVLSMANAGANTNGGQFFITYDATPHLNDKHSVFGKVIEGMEVLEQITPRDPAAAAEPGDLIESVTIEERG
jgi:cyclophilin family peptidyl-prolyl cis-trans isomerase